MTPLGLIFKDFLRYLKNKAALGKVSWTWLEMFPVFWSLCTCDQHCFCITVKKCQKLYKLNESNSVTEVTLNKGTFPQNLFSFVYFTQILCRIESLHCVITVSPRTYGSTILNSSGPELWDTFHNLNIYYANGSAIFSQQLLWIKMHNWCQIKALIFSFNMISHTFFIDLYFSKYIHTNYMASIRGWTGRHCGQKIKQSFSRVEWKLKRTKKQNFGRHCGQKWSISKRQGSEKV